MSPLPSAEKPRADSLRAAPAPAPAATPAPAIPSDSLRGAIDQLLNTLGDTVTPRAAVAPPDATAVPAPPEVTWDIDVRSYLSHDRVEYYVQRFTGEARERIVSWLMRGRRYEPMIRTAFRRHGIPEDMYYLGLVESGFDPHAYSRAAAVGMWQFMTATAKGMGLRVDWWIDERRDPVKSTVAAARFLSDLRDQFGSLYLAAAAYNGGPGRIARGVTRYADEMAGAENEDKFFVLASHRALRSETSNYVPQLIAAALVGKNPSRYGIRLDSVAPFVYDSIRVPPATPLAAVAKAADVPLASVRDLNPQILRGMTPPSDSALLRLPLGSVDRFVASFGALSDSERIALRKVTARKGATLVTEAKRAGLTSSQLRWYNPRLPRTKSGKLAAGQLLMVPTPAVLAAAYDVPDPAIERYGTASSNGVHIVRRGESLGSIAKRYHTSVASLLRLNKLRKPVIYPGQAIIVRGSGKASSTRARRRVSAATPLAKAPGKN